MRKHFEREVELLKKELLVEGGLVEEAIRRAMASVFDRDDRAANAVISGDSEIDEKELRIEETCLKIMALYNPVASDLRFIISTVKINNDLERMGDLAVNIAERALYMSSVPPIQPAPQLEPFSKHVRGMVRRALDSLVNEDSELALEITRSDEDADNFHRDTFLWVQDAMIATPGRIHQLFPMQAVSRSLERIADHATNIAEDVYYLVWGDIIRHHVKEFDARSDRAGQGQKHADGRDKP